MDGPYDWDRDVVASVARTHLEDSLKGDRKLVVTFDATGASGHVNHVATRNGLVRLRAAAATSATDPLHGMDWLQLESAPLYRRFASVFDGAAKGKGANVSPL